MELRTTLLQAQSCGFSAVITADYGDKVHTFAMDCRTDSNGCLGFTITKPETISGITGKITGDGGELTFDDTALHFELMAEDRLSPVSGPWIMMRTLRSGYMASAGTESGSIRLSMDDSYEEDALHLDIRLNDRNVPDHADIFHNGRKILSIEVANFEIL